MALEHDWEAINKSSERWFGFLTRSYDGKWPSSGYKAGFSLANLIQITVNKFQSESNFKEVTHDESFEVYLLAGLTANDLDSTH